MPIVTIALIAITCVVSWMAFDKRSLADRLVLWPPALERRHEYWRLLSYGFVHADIGHLAFNMITLFFFGREIERVMAGVTGSWLTYPLFYLAALAVSILPSYLKHRHDANYVSLGASGAVTAVLFAFILLAPWTLIFVFFIPVPAIIYAVFYVGYSLWMDKRGGDRINHSAHLSGAAFGVLFMVMMAPEVTGIFWRQLMSPRFG